VLQRSDAAIVRVAAMSPDAVADMVQDAVRANVDESLLDLAAKAHGNPFLVSELVGGLGEEGRLTVSGGRAVVSGDSLPRRLGASMQQRLYHLSSGAAEVVRVAAVLPDRFSAGLLAKMLERQPASLMSAVEEAVRADLLVEDDEQLRFRHDLLREATRQSLSQSVQRAMERQSASIMLSKGAAPAEVATQLVRSAEPGDSEAISALRQAAQTVGHSDASAAADLSKRALDLLPAEDAARGLLVAETVVESAPCRAMARPIDGAAMTWLDESKRIPSSGAVGLGVKGIGSLSPTFSTLTRGIGTRFLVKASIFSTSLMLRASGIGTPAFSAASSSSSPFHSFTASASAWYVPPLGLRSSIVCWRKAG
jgi:hypothetical protein